MSNDNLKFRFKKELITKIEKYATEYNIDFTSVEDVVVGVLLEFIKDDFDNDAEIDIYIREEIEYDIKRGVLKKIN